MPLKFIEVSLCSVRPRTETKGTSLDHSSTWICPWQSFQIAPPFHVDSRFFSHQSLLSPRFSPAISVLFRTPPRLLRTFWHLSPISLGKPTPSFSPGPWASLGPSGSLGPWPRGRRRRGALGPAPTAAPRSAASGPRGPGGLSETRGEPTRGGTKAPQPPPPGLLQVFCGWTCGGEGRKEGTCCQDDMTGMALVPSAPARGPSFCKATSTALLHMLHTPLEAGGELGCDGLVNFCKYPLEVLQTGTYRNFHDLFVPVRGSGKSSAHNQFEHGHQHAPGSPANAPSDL